MFVMASNGKRRKEESQTGKAERLHPDTKKSIWAIVMLGAAVILTLAGFQKAGPAGEFLFNILEKLLGWGYFVLPLTFFLAAVVFFVSDRRRVVGVTLLGVALIILSVLGLIDVGSPGNGGWLGRIFGYLRYPFGEIAAWVLNGIILLIGILITINTPLRLVWPARKAERETRNVEGEKVKAMEEKPEAEVEEKSPTLAEGEVEVPTESVGKKTLEVLPRIKRAPVQKFKDYVPPPLDLLKSSSEKPTTGDLRANANIIKRTLESFGITVEMGEINIGPKVTRYTLKPAEGVKLSRITALNQDLALALAAHPIRIEAPIPGKSLVGIEVPNKAAAIVRLGSLMSYPDFQTSGPLGFCLGRDVTGEPLFANIEKMPHLLIAGATGSGKTCSADTYVLSEQGMLTFREIYPLPLNSEKNFKVKVATRDGVETTSKVYNNGICDFYRIETEEGYHIEVTAEHPLWVLDENGKMRWMAGGEIAVGNYVAISRGPGLFGNRRQLNFEPSKNKTNKARLIKIPAEMTPELGLFLGLLAADGGLTVRNRIVYTQADPALLCTYQNLLKNLFGISCFIVQKSGKSNIAKDIIVHSAMLKEFLSYLGTQPVGAKDKEIPKSIRMAEPEAVKSFFRGLIRNDGHIGKNSLEICLASFKLLEQMQIMLLNFGIVSSLKRKKVKAYPNREYWRLSVYGSELVKYAEKIGFLTQEERIRAERILIRFRNPNKDVIPNLASRLRNLAFSYRTMFAKITNNGWQYQVGVSVPKYAFAKLKSYNNGDRNPTYPALRKILEFYQPLAAQKEHQEIKELADKKFYWARVKAICRTSGEGYDFEVPGSNSFVGNGFVNHNSVAIHSLIISLLYKNSPATLKMILIDPKRVELTVYENLPHLVSPVITEAKKTIGVFRWTLAEMDRRYAILQAAGSRDINSYNQNARLPSLREGVSGQGGKNDPLPYILIVVDELADLMASYGREVEGYIVRLAQMARATGLHLVLSTQRPSVEVITGLIKANITSRIALQVASQVDSRTILDTAGAEKLLGGGDLLFLSSELSKPKRIQGAYISEEEIRRVADFIRENNLGKVESGEILSFGNGTSGEGGGENDIFGDLDEEVDELYDEAVETVRRAKKASASLLQRRLKVGYARAARLLDLMEERGVIGPGEGAKPRQVYMDET